MANSLSDMLYRLFTSHVYSDLDRAGFWTMCLTLVTAFLLVIGWIQLAGIKKVSKADYINKFTDVFFSEETRLLMLLLDYNALKFEVKNIQFEADTPSKPFPYFAVRRDIAKQLFDKSELQKLKEHYSAFDTDDNLLGKFEDIGCFEKQGLIGIEGVYDTFDWYIQMVWQNPEIKKYIEHQQSTEIDGDDIYENFKYIFEKSSSFKRSKNKGEWKWWWALKWRIAPPTRARMPGKGQ